MQVGSLNTSPCRRRLICLTWRTEGGCPRESWPRFRARRRNIGLQSSRLPATPRQKIACARACVVDHLRFRDVNEANYETLNAAAARAALSLRPPSIAIWVTRVTRRAPFAKAMRGQKLQRRARFFPKDHTYTFEDEHERITGARTHCLAMQIWAHRKSLSSG